MNAQNRDCVSLCWEARTVCMDLLANHSLQKGGDQMESEHVKLVLDCIEICQVAADFMKRNSSFYTSVCLACASVCEACAASCSEIEDEKLQRCAHICWRCAESCRKISRWPQAA